MEDETQRLWQVLRDIEMRLRLLESNMAALLAVRQTELSRLTFLPSWFMILLILLITVISVLFSLWVAGSL